MMDFVETLLKFLLSSVRYIWIWEPFTLLAAGARQGQRPHVRSSECDSQQEIPLLLITGKLMYHGCWQQINHPDSLQLVGF